MFAEYVTLYTKIVKKVATLLKKEFPVSYKLVRSVNTTPYLAKFTKRFTKNVGKTIVINVLLKKV